MNKNQKNYLIGLVSTLLVFFAFVYFFLEPKYGPQIEVTEEQKGEREEEQEYIDSNTSEEDSVGMNPDYGELTEDQIQIADRAIGDLLNSSDGITPGMITVKSFEEQEFEDASLGCPQEGESYAQVVTPGYQITLEAQGEEYDYRVAEDSETVLLCD